MRTFLKMVIGVLPLATLLVTPAMAAGPVDGEFDALWWANDYDTMGPTADAGAPGFRAALWMADFGFKASQFTSSPDDFGMDDTDYLSLDVMWKAFAPTDGNYLAVGLGWEEADTLVGETSGMRISIEGRVGILGQVHAYGEGSYLPSLDDTPTLENADGIEYEVGVAWRAAPLISVKAGYRATDISFDNIGLGTNADSSGFLVGLGVHF